MSFEAPGIVFLWRWLHNFTITLLDLRECELIRDNNDACSNGLRPSSTLSGKKLQWVAVPIHYVLHISVKVYTEPEHCWYLHIFRFYRFKVFLWLQPILRKKSLNWMCLVCETNERVQLAFFKLHNHHEFSRMLENRSEDVQKRKSVLLIIWIYWRKNSRDKKKLMTFADFFSQNKGMGNQKIEQ